MAAHEAIGAVLNTMLALLGRFMAVRPDHLSCVPPDHIAKNATSGTRVNLFPYKVERSAGASAQDPGSPPGSLGRPPLAVEVLVLLTAYGKTETDGPAAQEILGDAMLVFHDHAKVHGRDPAYDGIRDPALDDARESVSISLEPVSVEDLTKVWTALTTPFRTSVVYRVTVAELRSRGRRRAAPLVRDGTRDARPVSGHGPAGAPGIVEGRRLQVVTEGLPILETVLVLRKGEPADAPPHVAYAAIGDSLVLQGSGLWRPPGPDGAARTRLSIGGLLLPVLADAPARLVVPLEDTPALARLQPSQVLVSVVLEDAQGRRTSSNERPALVIPKVTSAKATTAKVANEAPPPAKRTVPAVLVKGVRVYAAGAVCRTILHGGGKVAEVPGHRYINPKPTSFTVPLPPGFDPRGMAVRVLVDRHENLPDPAMVVAP